MGVVYTHRDGRNISDAAEFRDNLGVLSEAEVTAAIASAVTTLVGGAGSGFDTFGEIETALTAKAAGAASSTDNAVVRFHETTGKVLQNSGVIVDDSNNVTGVETLRAATSIGIASKPFWNSSADSKFAFRNSGSALLVDFAETLAGALTVQGSVNSVGTIYYFNGSQAITNSFPTLAINSGGTWTNTSITKLFATVPGTPSQITSNQNNYAPTAASILRLSSDASRDITGLAIGQIAGSKTEFWNVGAQNIVLKHADSNSTAANQFTNNTGADITLAAGEEASLKYDGTTSRWRVRKIA